MFKRLYLISNFFKNLKINLNFNIFILYFSLANILLYGYPLYKKFSTAYENFLITSVVFIFAYIVLVLFFSLIFFKKFYKHIAFIIILINSIILYFMLIYGIAFDANMIINVTETNSSEAFEFINLKLFLFTFIFGIIPAIFVYKKINVNFDKYFKNKIILIFSSILLIIAMVAPCYLFKPTFKFIKENQRITSYIIPVNYIGASIEFLIVKTKSLYNSLRLIKISQDAKIEEPAYNKNEKKNLIIFMLGESARAKNFSFNGYERKTNETLDKYKDEIISFKNFESCGTLTAISITCTFSHLPRKEFEYSESFKYESLIDIFNHVGFDIFWRSNNGRCKNICNRVKNSLVKSLGNNIYDDLLNKAFIMDLNRITKKNNLIVLHGRGSHGPLYYNRYPKEFEKYKPACNNEIDKCAIPEIINAYDNSIYYTSYLISEIIDIAKKNSDKFNTILIYMSDHGQSLGENGIFMHSAPFNTAPINQKNPAFFIWLSEDFEKTFNINKQCLKNKINDKISQDNIFHSMLGLFKIQSIYYNPNLDIFKDCMK